MQHADSTDHIRSITYSGVALLCPAHDGALAGTQAARAVARVEAVSRVPADAHRAPVLRLAWTDEPRRFAEVDVEVRRE
jgi:hypothetical protein